MPSKHERCTHKCLQGMQKFRDRSLVVTWHDYLACVCERRSVSETLLVLFLVGQGDGN